MLNNVFLSRRAAAAALFLCLLSIVGCDSLGGRGVEPGSLAPKISGIDLNSTPIDLGQISGKIVLVNFWATWCGPCVAELPALEKLYQNLKTEGFSVVGVAVDDNLDSVREYRDRYHITYPLILDQEGMTKRPYNIQGVPESFILDKDRRIVFVTDPSDGTPVTKIVGPRPWDQPQVVSLLRELLKGAN